MTSRRIKCRKLALKRKIKRCKADILKVERGYPHRLGRSLADLKWWLEYYESLLSDLEVI